jgi:YegS/Rv2252/BmrU family lipid kinase
MGHATEIAREAAEAGFDMAIAWGGDGTLNEVAHGLCDSATAMGVLPGGTINVFAREVGIPLKLSGALDTLVGGRIVRVPMGFADERPFLLMAGVGLDGEVVYRLKSGFKDALGAFAFWLDGFRLLASYPMSPVRVRVGEREIVGTGLIAGNIRRYGPRYTVTPDARLEEPKLDVVIFTGKNRRDYLRYLIGVLGHFHLRFSDVEHFKTDALSVSVDEGARVPLQLDGEPSGCAPVEIRVQDKALAVVLPAREE